MSDVNNITQNTGNALHDAKAGKNLQQLKEQNTLSILRLIRERGPVTRQQLKIISGLSFTSCAAITKGLIEIGLVREIGQGSSLGGRKPLLLDLNQEFGFVIGMVISSSGITCGVFDLRMNERSIKKINGDFSGEKIITGICECAFDILDTCALSPEYIVGMAIGVAGIVDTERYSIVVSAQLKFREITNILSEVEDLLPFPVYLENNGNLMALAEKKLYYPEYSSLVYIIVDEGIGGGVIHNDEIMRGTLGYVGEFGHMSIERNGPLCFCGNKGCLEILGSVSTLVQNATFGLVSHRDSYIKKYIENDEVTMHSIIKAFHDGDKLATQLFEEEADVLYHAVIKAITANDPQVIILGGEIIQFGENLLKRIREKIENTIFGFELSERVIAFSSLPTHAEICGAGMYAIESFLENSIYKSILSQDRIDASSSNPV